MPTPSPLSRSARSTSTEEVIVSEHLAELRGRVRLFVWISGLSWTVLVLLGGLIVSGTLDWLIRFDDAGTRLIVGLSILIGSGWMAWRQLIAPLSQRLSASFLAARVERRFPDFDNRIVSAVEFLEHRLDPKLGSSELQKVVIAQALKDLERIEASDIVETKAVRRASIAGSLVSVIAVLIMILSPREAATSVQRLMFPFSNVPWPRTIELQLVRPDLSPVVPTADRPLYIARGDTLELYVQNKRGRLPDRVWFEYRIGDDGPIQRETLRQTTIRDESGQSRETAVINWIATRGTLHFRASGGDDTVMPFHHVEVVPPPNVESLQVVVEPPRYSRQPKESLPPGVGHVQGLLGTKVNVTVTCDKPLKSASLRIGEQPGISLELDANGLHFSATFEIKEPSVSSYWFELTDMLGFTDREAIRYELRGIADGVPDVNIEIPVADVSLTADAELPIKILAKDDLGLRDVSITYQVGDLEQTPAIIPLLANTLAIDRDSTADSPDVLTIQSLGPQRHEADYVWKMSDLHLEPGTRIVFRAEATDDYDLGQPHVGKSVPRTITIVSSEDKQKELATRVGDLLDDLKQAAQLQQRALQQTDELRTQIEKVGELRPQDFDQLQRTELDQRQAASRLTNPADGVESQAKHLLDEFRGNKLTDARTEQRLNQVVDELARLEHDVLPQVEQALTQAQKLAEGESHQVPSATEKALAEAESKQTQSLETLKELQESLAEWRDRQDVTRDLDTLMAEQESVQKDSAEMAQRTMTKSAAELTNQEKAELNKLAARQRKVADQLEQFRKQLDQTAGSLQKNDPDVAEKFSEAEQELKNHETASKLEDAAQNIAENKMGAAIEAQKSAMDELHDVERMMKRQPNEDTEQFLKQAQDAQNEFHQMRQDQQDLADRAEELVRQPDSPEKQEQIKEVLEQQEELTERMAKAERKLERLRLRGSAEAAHRARKRLTEMMKEMQDADDADEMPQAMDEALDDLEQVERELVLEKRIAQERLAFEQLEKIEDELKSLRSRQETVFEEIVRLEAAKSTTETLSRGQLKTLKELAEVERSLQQVAERMQQQMASTEVFSLFLKRLARTLTLTADGLNERETGDPIQAHAKDAIRKIDRLLSVLKQEQKKKDQPQQPAEKSEELNQEPQEQDEKPEDAQPPGDSIPQLAQLKLLKAMQEEYLERTEVLETFRNKDGTLPESVDAEKNELAREQAELADYTRNLIAKFRQQQTEQKKPEDEKPKSKSKDKDEHEAPRKSEIDL